MAAVVGVVIALEMAAVLLGGFRVGAAPVPDAAAVQMGNTKLLGIELYTNYLYPLEIAAVILLVAIVAAIALTLRRRKDSKGQNPSRAGQGPPGRPRAHRQDEADAGHAADAGARRCRRGSAQVRRLPQAAKPPASGPAAPAAKA